VFKKYMIFKLPLIFSLLLLCASCSKGAASDSICLRTFDISAPDFETDTDLESPRSLPFFLEKIVPRVLSNNFQSPVLCLSRNVDPTFANNRGLFLTGSGRGIHSALILLDSETPQNVLQDESIIQVQGSPAVLLLRKTQQEFLTVQHPSQIFDTEYGESLKEDRNLAHLLAALQR
jgi:hypothetical protein